MNEYIEKPDMQYILHIKCDKNVEKRLIDFCLESVADVFEDTGLTADVQPVKHGRWIETHISFCNLIPEDKKEERHSFFMAEMQCSCCKKYNTVTFALSLNKSNFCPNCGARMDGDSE